MPEWLPYCGAAPLPAELASRWNADIFLLLAVGAIAWLWWRTSGHVSERARPFAASLVLFAGLFVSPFCALGSALFAARVVHHVLLATLLAPLLVASFGEERFRIAALSLPMLTAVQALVFWAWHAPPLYAAALSNDLTFWAMQISITLSAAVWWAALRRAEPIAAVAALLATMVQMGLLGALLTFTGRALYAPHAFGAVAWGFTPLEDQQIAGVIMWAPASAIYLLVAAVTLYRSLEPARAR